MQPNESPAGVGHAGHYVPYFYQAGLYVRYNIADQRSAGPSSNPVSSGYDFSSPLPVWSDRGKVQTVEEVITRGYLAVPAGDSVAAIITDKQHTARLGLDDVIRQVRSRVDLYQQNMQELDESVCEMNNAVHRQEADQGIPANEHQRYSANKIIQQIYEQKRTERVNLWRDISRLRLGLPEQAQQYLSAYRKVAALQSYQGDTP